VTEAGRIGQSMCNASLVFHGFPFGVLNPEMKGNRKFSWQNNLKNRAIFNYKLPNLT